MLPEKLTKPYNPQETEDRIYARWEESGFFNPDNMIDAGVLSPDAEPYTIILPPPNVTGTLHIGHAAMLAIEDVFIRHARMSGKRALWVPGTDHAAIATASKVESKIYKEEKKTRYDLGREEFLKRVDTFAQESHDTIVNQLKKMGSSLDWSREAFTLDAPRTTAVNTAFVRMFEAGLIYRGNRVVNWDPKGQTTISDDEIIYEEGTAKLYTFRYSADFPIAIATTRPETKVGDTAVAVNPNDKRYAEYVGKEYDIEFAGTHLHIKIIGDESIDPEYGTGALGVTPAHSGVDWELARKHGLPLVQVIDERARMMESAGPIVAGQKTKEARETIVAWLRENELLEKEEEVEQRLSKAERTGAVVEPLPKLQWFVDVNKPFALSESHLMGVAAGQETTLRELMRRVVDTKQISITPDQFEKIYFHWVENLRDWCISRQIWYGHRIPVWYCTQEAYEACTKPIASTEPVEQCPVCGGEVRQDEDTLDTWFSSGLWTFSTLGWPEKTKDLEIYHPTTLLETGYDILFFWVARMILMTGFLLGDVPFRTVYLHGLVRDGKGRKMSKSLGNIIDPLDLIEKFGADATRMALIVGNSPGSDVKLSEDKVKAYKHFSNKIWNITRFVLTNTEEIVTTKKPDLHYNEMIGGTDDIFYSSFQSVVWKVTNHLKDYRLHLAAEELHNYIWHIFADKELEKSKPIFANGTDEEKLSRAWVLLSIWSQCIKMLHPFMPFVTEEIWSIMPSQFKKRDLLIAEPWPIDTRE